MATATKKPKVKKAEEVPFKQLWLNSCYQQTLLPDAPWHKVDIFYSKWNLSNPIHQGTTEMCRIVQDVRTCLIRHTKGPWKCVGLYRMSEYSGFILINRNTLGP